jgi:anti-anti-sigma regulatory factor
MIAPPQNRPGELHVLAETDQIAALCLEGEFDLANAPQIIEEGERLPADDKQVILDLSDATFIDSSVIQALSRLGAEAMKTVASRSCS